MPWFKIALHHAAYAGSTEIIGLLLARHANINAQDGDGQTPLKVAVKEGNKEAAELLRRHGGRE